MAKDRKIDMVILGLLAHDDLTGYDIKKQIDGSIRFFWKGSFGSIYPALASLEEMKCVRRVSNEGAHSGRERIAYSITEIGRAHLREWLEQSKTVNDLKYEVLLKLFFGGAADNSVSIATIEAFEEDIKSELSVLKICRDNLAEATKERDHLFYYLTVTFGVETYEGYLRWCKEAKEILLGQGR